MRKSCLVKLSGDMLTDKALAWIKELSEKYFVVICVGGGTQINRAFAKAGLPVKKHGPLGRETRSLKERQLARDVLERNQAKVQDRLAALDVHVSVVIPVLEIGTVLCHVNGDQFLLTSYLGFDILYAVTLPDRLQKKRKQFAQYKKIRVIAF